MLKSALNALTKLHSRPAMLKRLGQVDAFSPCRITPSNYFRFLRGPEYTTIKGVEFIIPVDSMTGQFAQTVSFGRIPDAGGFKLKFGASVTAEFSFNVTAVDIQTEIRKIPSLSNALVTGSFITGFKITYTGFSTSPALVQIVDNTLEESSEPVVVTAKNTPVKWEDLIKKGDRIIDDKKQWTIDEIIEMHDLGAQVMAVRVRCD